MGDDAVRRDFDRSAPDWDNNPARVRMTSALADAVLDRLPLDKSLVAMDYGAGTGLVTLRLQPLVGRVVAADTSPGMLSVLKRKIEAAGLRNVSLSLWNVEEDPLPPERYDLVVSTMTFHHLRDIPAVLARFHEILKPGGRIAVGDLDLEDGDFHTDPVGVWHLGFDRGVLRMQAEAAGFAGVRIETAHRFEREVAGGRMKEFSLFLLTAEA